MPTSLAVSASRGLGFELAKRLHSLGHNVYAIIRSSKFPDCPMGVNVIQDIDPGLMKTDMTKSVGFDEFDECGGAIEPSEAAVFTIDFVLGGLTHGQTAPRGLS
ncbi:hypothetical protein K523DRAFT_357380 [Schizophyllum commune Tattone D]|nr:hypothetical protein K523DRAFT_357380 [Schizophyllum commune Tattone D]